MLRTVLATIDPRHGAAAAAVPAQTRTQGFGRDRRGLVQRRRQQRSRVVLRGARGDRVGRQPSRRRRRPQRRHPRPRMGSRRRARPREDRRLCGHRRGGTARRVRRAVVTTGGSVRAEGPDGGADGQLVGQLRDPGAAHGAADVQHQQRRDLDRGFPRHREVSRAQRRRDARATSRRHSRRDDQRRRDASISTGDRWDGAGLDVETHNGGIRMTPARTLLGRARNRDDQRARQHRFSGAVQGTFGRSLNTTLGAGGAKIRAITTNGGVTIRRRL